MPSKKKYIRRYKGVLFTKKDINKITGIHSREPNNIKFAYRFIRHLYKKTGLSNQEIANMFDVDTHLINKIVTEIQKTSQKKSIQYSLYYEEIRDNPLALSLENYLGKKAFSRLLKSYNCSSKEIKSLLKKIYRLWHKSGSYTSLSARLNIPSSKVPLIINLIKVHKIIKNFRKPRGKLTEGQIKRIMETKNLYDELKTLSKVGKQLGLSRERVRQILERGKRDGIIDYKPSHLKGFDDIANNLKKEDIQKLLLKYGSKRELISNLKDKYKINMNHLNALIVLHNIDLDYLILQRRKNRCLSEYNDMVRELGFHPTTTVMSKRPKWRALWSRITSIWGNMDNFRKEFGIPIPRKGNPRFREIMINASRKRAERKRAKLNKILELINQNSPTNFRGICQSLNINESPLYAYLKELREGNEVDWMYDKGRILYLRKK